jgi:predicted enzyme related to lactoylglutathione lyase
MTGKLTHFEIYGDDPEALADFYRSVLGWSVERAPGVDYWRVQAGEQAGGLAYPPPFARTGWMNFVQVESVAAALDAAVAAGGTILKPRSAVPKTAWHAVVADPAGSAFVVWEPDPLAMPLPEPD